MPTSKTNDELRAILKAEGLTDEEIAKLGNDDYTWASLQQQQAKKVMTIEIEIPAGTDREISAQEFQDLMHDAASAVSTKMWLSTALSFAGSALKVAMQKMIQSQTGIE